MRFARSLNQQPPTANFEFDPRAIERPTLGPSQNGRDAYLVHRIPARTARQAHSGPRRPRGREPRPPPVTRLHIAKFGTIPEAAPSRKLGLDIGTGFEKRQKLGIPASRPPKFINWTPAIISELGKIPDGDVALRTGINKVSVAWKRCKLKIPSFTQKRSKNFSPTGHSRRQPSLVK